MKELVIMERVAMAEVGNASKLVHYEVISLFVAKVGLESLVKWMSVYSLHIVGDFVFVVFFSICKKLHDGFESWTEKWKSNDHPKTSSFFKMEV